MVSHASMICKVYSTPHACASTGQYAAALRSAQVWLALFPRLAQVRRELMRRLRGSLLFNTLSYDGTLRELELPMQVPDLGRLGLLDMSMPHFPEINKALARHPRQLAKLGVRISCRSRSR